MDVNLLATRCNVIWLSRKKESRKHRTLIFGYRLVLQSLIVEVAGNNCLLIGDLFSANAQNEDHGGNSPQADAPICTDPSKPARYKASRPDGLTI